jgi:hypothetical protein
MGIRVKRWKAQACALRPAALVPGPASRLSFKGGDYSIEGPTVGQQKRSMGLDRGNQVATTTVGGLESSPFETSRANRGWPERAFMKTTKRSLEIQTWPIDRLVV